MSFSPVDRIPARGTGFADLIRKHCVLDAGTLGIVLRDLAGCGNGPGSLLRQVLAVGLPACDLLELLAGDGLLDLDFTSWPAAHEEAFRSGVTSNVGDALICRTRESASSAHC